ncbi:hypothetical protein DCO48_04300 [Pseudomonas sp. SDI]|uniref:PilW family protein n=1 Tax=Pseudomonas sp. SDI TaxID=2170734 RepID=UPI000DE6379D|nr:hypothetical protein [Pseudomonas sp. SDI]PWB34823.1 hypothetical protein DCO48_04300 [Pseudomonas sp. SDI]
MTGQRGFGLVEALLALGLGLIVLLAGSRLFVTAVKTWQAQTVAARLQDDARLALLRISRDIRASGMFGCLRTEATQFSDATSTAAFREPLRLESRSDGSLRSLSLLVSEPAASGAPTWTVVTDCLGFARVYAGEQVPGPGEYAFAIRRQTYRVADRQLLLSSGGSSAVLIEDVDTLAVRVEPASIHLELTLSDPQQRVRPQTYRLSSTLRNRVPG